MLTEKIAFCGMGLWTETLHWSVLLKWVVVGTLIGILLAVGAVLLSIGRYWGANMCFVLSAVWLFAKVVELSASSQDSAWPRLLFTFVFCRLIGVATVEVVRAVNNYARSSRGPQEPPPISPTATTSNAAETPAPGAHTIPAEPLMKLTFKDSPLLTPKVQSRIRRDLTLFRNYFVALGIDTTAELPPIGIADEQTGTVTAGQGLLPAYRWKMMIGEKSLNDPTAITEAYSGYVLQGLVDRRRRNHPSADTMQDMRAVAALSVYFNWSFWNRKPAREGAYWASQLWQIREELGRGFTDEMLAYTLKAVVDTPEENANADFDIYFYGKIKTGDSVVDNDGKKLARITDIIEKSGISVTKPKAELALDASALKQADGSLLIRTIVANQTDVAAQSGQFRIQLFPDGRFTKEPAGSSKDTSTTLQTIRVFSFDSILPHERRAVDLEVLPILGPGQTTFSLIFSYVCETCAVDSRIHKLDLHITQ